MENNLQDVLALCPAQIGQAILTLPAGKISTLEEIRLRVGGPAMVTAGGESWCLSQGDRLIDCTQKMVTDVVTAAAEQSLYAAQEQLRQGFCTIRGGHRVGVCGRAVAQGGQVQTLKEFSSVNIRVAREITGAANVLAGKLWSQPRSTLILGPPGAGKTTVLRDLIRQMSDKFRYRVAVADERGELAACVNGRPQFRVGKRTDILTGCPKEQSIYMLLRTMNPQWIALDELSTLEDVSAICRASYCGVRFVATAHAWSTEDLLRRPVYRALAEEKVFENLAVIEKDRSLRWERMSA